MENKLNGIFHSNVTTIELKKLTKFMTERHFFRYLFALEYGSITNMGDIIISVFHT